MSFKRTEPDLTDTPLSVRDTNLYIDDSSFAWEGIRYTGLAIVTSQNKVIWTQALLRDASSPKAEIIALTQALKWAKEKKVHIYTDSQYVFDMDYVHGQINKENY